VDLLLERITSIGKARLKGLAATMSMWNILAKGNGEGSSVIEA
jgi:hypothetical protein